MSEHDTELYARWSITLKRWVIVGADEKGAMKFSRPPKCTNDDREIEE